MKQHQLGGNWTQEKLERVRQYMKVENAAELDVLLPAILDKAFWGTR